LLKKNEEFGEVDLTNIEQHSELSSFLNIFNFHKRGKEQLQQRKKEWNTWDFNGNGYMSLAEVDKAVMERIVSKTKSKTLWH